MGFAAICSDLLEFCGVPFRFFLHRVPWQAVLFSFAGLACAPSLSKKSCFAGHEPPAGLAFCGLRPLAVPLERARKNGGPMARRSPIGIGLEHLTRDLRRARLLRLLRPIVESLRDCRLGTTLGNRLRPFRLSS